MKREQEVVLFFPPGSDWIQLIGEIRSWCKQNTEEVKHEDIILNFRVSEAEKHVSFIICCRNRSDAAMVALRWSGN